MEVIPVIDLRGGDVVRAQAGRERRDYPLLRSALCPDASPHTFLSSLQAMHAVRSAYIADLDALSGHGAQWSLIAAMAERHPQTCFWVDAGFRDAAGITAMPRMQNLLPIIGSETWRDGPLATACASRCVLSLDFRAGERLGMGDLGISQTRAPTLRVILMCLDRMGDPRGPDFQRLADARARAPQVQWILAGGVRNGMDLARAGALGASAVLASTALHRGELPHA